ncbi:nitrous oxide reductase family maturation protein NosD [Paenibacillus sp. MBLB4367]|uniref:right-handed parallel beta-helix repeat-containing protein n=1 Tax=Paenibacillus sp. MBLB4367 TaxID=3384767 RepID=UPI0039081FBA
MKQLKLSIITGMFVIFTLVLYMTAATSHAQALAMSPIDKLQDLIDQTKAGQTVRLPAGIYEGTLIINKPLHLLAEQETRIVNTSKNPAVSITADGVKLEGLTITQNAEEESSAVFVSANEVVLEKLIIYTRSFGILLRDADRNEIIDCRIEWLERPDLPPVKLSEKRNGIDLYHSHENTILQNDITGMNDGIYLESSHKSAVERNRIKNSRYGVHCMYTEETIVRGNTGMFNITGAMVMGVKDAEVSGNSFMKQSESVNSQGLLLFDVQTSRIYDNKVEGNRVGLYIEQSNKNELWNNDVFQNFVGIQLLESEGNRFTANRFIGNVIDAESADSVDNELYGNFWDSFRGIDTDKDGMSDIAYAINPFFQSLTSDTPAYQLFFQSPGMVFLESMMSAGKEEWTTDNAPLMSPDKEEDELSPSSNSVVGVTAISFLLLAISITTITVTGVKRR